MIAKTDNEPQALGDACRVPGTSSSVLPIGRAVRNGRTPLVRALLFIRERAEGRMTVGDVVRASGLSRRALEKHFRAGLGRTVLEEIRRSRTEHFARLLVETDLTVTAIGALLGFSDVKHLARYFRAAKRMSPTAYRKAHRRDRRPLEIVLQPVDDPVARARTGVPRRSGAI